MTRSIEQVEAVRKLAESGLNDCAISRATGIPRPTVAQWRRDARWELLQNPPGRGSVHRSRDCPLCDGAELHPGWYAYLLGLYLGDGCISPYQRDVFRLRIALDLRYPQIISECSQAMAAMRANGRGRVGHVRRPGYMEVSAYWKHWPCLFPQYGPGPKHLRRIELAHRQADIVSALPHRLLRGLIHSDGWRGNNHIKDTGYPRYQFSNSSRDIQRIFTDACEDYGGPMEAFQLEDDLGGSQARRRQARC
ncbi:MAG: hypothetical protein H0U16_06885 [Actinobacteria bacterium]|nr:hypothetical protein [Actinomycetota bacterium]